MTNSGLPQQIIPGSPARQGSIATQQAGVTKQIELINPTGGKRRRTRRRRQKKTRTRRRRLRGGTGSNGNSPSTISPPIVPNTGATAGARDTQQTSYNQLAELSSTVNENSKYDKLGGRKSRKRKHKRKYGKRKSRK